MSAFKVAFVALLLGAIGAVAVWQSPSWFPVQAAVQARRQDELYLALMIMSSFVFFIVVTFLVYSMWKFRVAPGDMTDGEPIHGNTMLEIVWTAIPTIIVVGFAIAAGIVLSQNERISSTSPPLVVEVTGQQFAWSYYYPAQKVHSGVLELPVGGQVEFHVTSVPGDVIHEFYISAFREGTDAVPGITTTLVADPTRIGTYTVVCLELCGIGHSQMRSIVDVVSRADFDTWITQQKAAAAPPPSTGPVDAKAVFSQNCGSCHTLSAASTTGIVGPNLDNLAADATKYGAGASAAQYVRDSIVDPSKVVVSPYPDHLMPATFGTSLSSADIDALVTLLTGGK